MDFSEVIGITFDAAGTLITPHPSVGAVYAEVLSHHGVTVPAGDLNSMFKSSFSEALKKTRENINETTEIEFWRNISWKTFGRFCSDKDFELIFKDLFETFALARRWKISNDALPTLQSLKDRNYRLALLSNWDKRLRNVAAECGIGKFFETIFISSEVGFEKPDRRIFSHVEKSMVLNPKNILHIGDSPDRDAAGAINAGWNAIILDPENRIKDYYRINCLIDLLSYLPHRPRS